MYQVVICEDRPDHASYLRELVDACGAPFHVRACCKNAADLDMCLQQDGMPDILLMDIALEDDSGIETVKKLVEGRSSTQVIYVTGYIEYCTSVYETDHVSFLLKPVQAEVLRVALERAAKKAELYNRDGLTLRTGSGVSFIRFHQILYLESSGRKVLIYAEEGMYSAYTTLDALSQSLDMRFYRCHKSFFVNLDAVKELCGHDFLLKNNTLVPISSRHTAEAKTAFLHYLSRRLA
ncbi:MAG: response regulator transcription factor [Oscillibacter sp.]|nr:response regulator transcription factor [Oscillibacter sp.]